jgi:indolepyruvate ferredoxin oxidoreductase alpha subunit
MAGDYTGRAAEGHRPSCNATIRLPSPRRFAMSMPSRRRRQDVGAPRPCRRPPRRQPPSQVLPPRPPGLCVGCPERPIFSALKLVERELGMHHVSATSAATCSRSCRPSTWARRRWATAWAGPGVGIRAQHPRDLQAHDRLHGRRRLLAQRPDERRRQRRVQQAPTTSSSSSTTATRPPPAAGHPFVARRQPEPQHPHPIEKAVRGVGVEWVRTSPAPTTSRRCATPARGADHEGAGPKVVVAQSECMLNRQRREKPAMAKAIEAGERVVRERFGVDADTCTGDHACIRPRDVRR